MKAIVLNASPRIAKSNTMVLTKAFLEGTRWTDIVQYDLYRMNIKFCRGCFGCWSKTPGKCVIQDDWNTVLADLTSQDDIVTLLSFPLYAFGLPGILKTVLERCLPLCLPDIEVDDQGAPHHPPRYPNRRERALCISTCGFPVVNDNYEGVSAFANIFYGDETPHEEVFCPMGELLYDFKDQEFCKECLALARQAGEAYARDGVIGYDLKQALAGPMIPVKKYIQFAKDAVNASIK